MRIVTAGLQAGEQVIVKGLQRVRPGQKVEAEVEAARVAGVSIGDSPFKTAPAASIRAQRPGALAGMARFFINRPIFAAVISVVITLAGGIAVMLLPVAQYPEITPPTVQVNCTYPGASAKVVAETVAAPIEQQVIGVENMLYMSSQCTNDGGYNLTVTFEVGTNLDMAQVLVQNRVNLALPTLPNEVKQTGVSVKKKSPSILLVVNLISPTGTYDQLYLSNYATIRLRDELAQVKGVGDVTYLGQLDYSMRAWLDPESNGGPKSVGQRRRRGAARAERAGRRRIARSPAGAARPGFSVHAEHAGTTRRSPAVRQHRREDGRRWATHPAARPRQRRAQGRGGPSHRRDSTRRQERRHVLQSRRQAVDRPGDLSTAGLERAGHGGRRPVADGGAQDAAFRPTWTTRSSTIRRPSSRNRSRKYSRPCATPSFSSRSWCWRFLQSWRATIIPLIAVPVAIVGTFAVMLGMGFSLNNLSLFGLVLAIGIVVDDAIVVVEAVEHHLEHGLSPKQAAEKAMSEVSGPIIAISLVLMCVFIPCAFITGITGQFFRQFALTIAVSTFFSAVNSLTLSPALCGLLLQAEGRAARSADTGCSTWRSAGFSSSSTSDSRRPSNVYARGVGISLRVSVIVLVVYGGLLYLTYFGFTQVPTGFIPSQDKGYLLVDVRLPDSASLERTQEVMAQIEQIARGSTGPRRTSDGQQRRHSRHRAHDRHLRDSRSCRMRSARTTDRSMSFSTSFTTATAATWGPMPSPRSFASACYREVQEASVAVFGAPAVDGLGNAGGFKVMVRDVGDLGLDASAGSGRRPGRHAATSSRGWWACTARSAHGRRRCSSTSIASAARRWASRSTKSS